MSSVNSGGIDFDVRSAWKKTKKELDSMTPKERAKTLVESGILTKKGAVAKPYAKAIK